MSLVRTAAQLAVSRTSHSVLTTSFCIHGRPRNGQLLGRRPARSIPSISAPKSPRCRAKSRGSGRPAQSQGQVGPVREAGCGRRGPRSRAGVRAAHRGRGSEGARCDSRGRRCRSCSGSAGRPAGDVLRLRRMCGASRTEGEAPSRVGGRNRQPQERLPMRAHALEHKSACSPTTALPPISPLPGPSMPLVCPRQTSTVFFRPESLVHMHLQFLSHHETLSDGSGIGPSSSQSNSCLLGSRKNLRKRRLSSASRRALRDSARLARRGPKSERRRMLLRTGLGNSRSKRLASVEERLSRTQGNQNAGKILR